MGSEELYIAAIVSPYDDQAHGDVSVVTWFHVAHEVGRIPGPDQDPLQAGCRPMALQVICYLACQQLSLQFVTQTTGLRFAGCA